MDEQREIYLDGYANGLIGRFDDWSEDDINYFLGKVLKERAWEKWWTTKQIWTGGREETPRNMWSESFDTAKEVYNKAISYLDTSFS